LRLDIVEEAVFLLCLEDEDLIVSMLALLISTGLSNRARNLRGDITLSILIELEPTLIMDPAIQRS